MKRQVHRPSCRQAGGALAVAVFGALVAQRETFVDGIRVSLVIAALLLLAMAVPSAPALPGTVRPARAA